MKPVDQTDTTSTTGNCFSACVASLLELPIEAVPFFMGHERWYDAFAEWLKPHGFYPVTFKLAQGDAWRPAGLHILAGKSPRGAHSHAVVARGSEIVHDPHPSRGGLGPLEDVTLLIPFEPHRARTP